MADLGSIHFSVKYENNKLDIKIIECQGLKDADGIGKSDPYVRLFILPGRHTELKTKTINNNLNPVFNSSFSFTLTTTQVMSKTAIFQVFDSDFGKDGKLGEARVPFADLDLGQAGEVSYWRALVPISETLKSTPTVKSRSSVSSVSSTVVSRESSINKKVSNVSSFSTTLPAERSYSSSSYRESGYSTYKGSNGLNIRDLNNRLDEVVKKNKSYGEVDTKLIINLLSKKVNDKVSSQVVLNQIEQNLQPLRDEYNKLAMMNAEIEILKRENEIMRTRTEEVEEKIRNRGEKERELANSLRDMESKHHLMMRERDTVESRRQSHEIQLREARDQMKPIMEQLRSKKLDYGKWEGELYLMNEKFNLCGSERDRMWSSYSAEFEREVECPTIYWEIINEYSRRMDDEVGKLKEMYMSYNNEMQGFEGKEIARLNSTLSETSHVGGDLNGILGELEIVKAKMLELEMDKLSIRQKIFEVKFAIDQEEALFYAQFDAKEGALAFLRAEYEAMKRKFFSNLARVEESEVSRYARMIDHEAEWVGRRAETFESGGRRVIAGLSLTPRVDSKDGDVIGWDIEEHWQS